MRTFKRDADIHRQRDICNQANVVSPDAYLHLSLSLTHSLEPLAHPFSMVSSSWLVEYYHHDYRSPQTTPLYLVASQFQLMNRELEDGGEEE